MIPVILASTSRSRIAMLHAAGVAFTIVAPNVDEATEKERMLTGGVNCRRIAEHLAERKARQVSSHVAGLVVGADQTLELSGALIDKAADLQAARANLLRLRGCTHALHTAVALARDGAPIWRQTITARLTMRRFSDTFLEGYLAANGEAATASPGGYFLEGEGAQLFEHVDGDFFGVLGLPLLGLLDALRAWGGLAS